MAVCVSNCVYCLPACLCGVCQGDCTPIEAAVSLGNPFDLVISNDNIRKVSRTNTTAAAATATIAAPPLPLLPYEHQCPSLQAATTSTAGQPGRQLQEAAAVPWCCATMETNTCLTS